MRSPSGRMLERPVLDKQHVTKRQRQTTMGMNVMTRVVRHRGVTSCQYQKLHVRLRVAIV